MLELYGSKACPFTAELREDLQWRGLQFSEYDVETDPSALQKMLLLTPGSRTVPVLAHNGQVVQIGWQGRGCVVGAR